MITPPPTGLIEERLLTLGGLDSACGWS